MSEVVVKAAKEFLSKLEPDTANDVVFDIENVVENDVQGSGAGMIMTATTSTGCLLASSALVERGAKAEVVAESVAKKFCEELSHGGCTDEYLQDQLIIFAALANGKSSILTGPLSLHTRTALKFVGQLTGVEFQVTPLSDEKNHEDQAMLTRIECTGIAFGVEK